MRQEHADFCQNELGYKGKIEIWEVKDLNEMEGFVSSSEALGIENDLNHIKLTEKTYELITKKVDELVTRV